MLILARKVGEAIAIADDIKVRVIDIKGGQVRLGVEAPDHVVVHREEIYQRIVDENRRAAETPGDLAGIDGVFLKRPAPERK